MNKQGLIRALAEKLNDNQKDFSYSQKDAAYILDSLQNVVFDTLKDEEEVKLFDGLVLSVVEKSARTARNPMTGETIEVPAKKTVKAKFGKAVKELFA